MKIRPNRVKDKLAAGQIATILAGSNDPDLIDQLGTLDVDGIWLEGEHGGVDFADLGNLTRACDSGAKNSVVRVQDNDYATIYRTLDRGAQAIVVPHVNTRAEAQAVVDAAKFAPARQARHVHEPPGLRRDRLPQDRRRPGAADGADRGHRGDRAASTIILKVDHIDVFFVAPGDLAASMGHIGNMGHPDVRRSWPTRSGK